MIYSIISNGMQPKRLNFTRSYPNLLADIILKGRVLFPYFSWLKQDSIWCLAIDLFTLQKIPKKIKEGKRKADATSASNRVLEVN